MREAAKEAEAVTNGGTDDEQTVQLEDTASVDELLLRQTWVFLSGLLITVFLLYFLLASGGLLLRKLVRMFPSFAHRRNAVRIVRGIERHLSRYLGMVCIINFGLGMSVWGTMYLIGMSNPGLLDALAGLLNFIPYLGPLVNITIVGLVALVSFESVTWALHVPGACVVLNGIEASVVTPTAMGWHLRLNPVVIFIALTFWTWVWGIAGALLAVPLLATIKLTCDRIESLRPVGIMLGQ